jgi:hypothetical protein
MVQVKHHIYVDCYLLLDTTFYPEMIKDLGDVKTKQDSTFLCLQHILKRINEEATDPDPEPVSSRRTYQKSTSHASVSSSVY